MVDIVEECEEPTDSNANEMEEELLLDFVKSGLLPVFLIIPILLSV